MRLERPSLWPTFTVLILCCRSLTAEPPSATPGASPKMALERAHQASIDADEDLHSAIGVCNFEQFIQYPGEKEMSLRTKARVQVSFDRGKYCMKFDFEKRLVRIKLRDGKGNEVERDGDRKNEQLVLQSDGMASQVIHFSPRFIPAGCEINTYSDVIRAENQMLGLGLLSEDLARLWVIIGRLDQWNVNDALVEQPNGTFRGNLRIKNAPKLNVEFIVDPKSGYHVTQYRYFNEGQEDVVTLRQVDWKKSGSVWYAARSVDESPFNPKLPERARHRYIIEYESFDVNPEVDPEVFTLRSLDIPARTRLFDRTRKKDPKPD